MNIAGIDVSHWQSKIDWREIAKAGILFAYLKCTEQDDFEDERFEENIIGCEENGILWGAYHFWRPQYPAWDQAAWFDDHLKGRGQLPPACDFEVKGAKEKNTTRSLEFLEAVQETDGRLPIIYTGPNWLKYEILPRQDGYAKYPLWIAHYTDGRPMQCYPFANYHIHQWSQTGQLPGIKGNCDLDYFNGNLFSFIRFIGMKYAVYMNYRKIHPWWSNPENERYFNMIY